MKLGILSFIIFITIILTYKVFLDFQNRWEETEIFQRTIINSPLIMKYLLVSPEQLGIDKWSSGDYAAYELKTNSESRQISFYVAAREPRDSKQHWLRTDGLSQFNEAKIELWRLLSETSLLPGNETDGFFFVGTDFLFPLSPTIFPTYPILLEELGFEIVKTPAGEFHCQHYFVSVRSPSGNLEPLFELWTNPSVHPLGIVRARWRDETLNLLNMKVSLPIDIPKVLSAIPDQKRIRDQGCAQCHRGEIGGRDLRFPSKYLLSGTELNLTACLFHYHQLGLVKTSDLVHLQLISDHKQFASKELVRFKWEKGSFWVNVNKNGRLTLSIDAFVFQGNLRAIPRTGSLVLNLQR